MKYINQNINFVLLALVVVAVVTLLGATIHYQGIVERLTQNNQDKKQHITSLNSSLLLRTNELAAFQKQLLLKEERESRLSTEYTTIKGEKEDLVQEKKGLEDNLEETQDSLELSKINLAKKESDLKTAHAKIDDLEDDVTSLKKEVKKYKDRLDNCEDDLQACQNQQQ